MMAEYRRETKQMEWGRKGERKKRKGCRLGVGLQLSFFHHLYSPPLHRYLFSASFHHYLYSSALVCIFILLCITSFVHFICSVVFDVLYVIFFSRFFFRYFLIWFFIRFLLSSVSLRLVVFLIFYC